MAVTLVQSKVIESGSTWMANGTQAFNSNVTAGNTLIVLVAGWYYSFEPTLTDTLGNVYTRIGPSVAWNPTTGSTGNRFFGYSTISGSSGACTITATAIGGGAANGAVLAEVSGLATPSYDVTSLTNIDDTSPVDTGSLTPTVDGAYIMGFFSRVANVASAYSNGALFTVRGQSPVNQNVGFADYIQPTAGTITPEVVATTSVAYPTYGVGVSFKPAAGGAVTQNNLSLLGIGT